MTGEPRSAVERAAAAAIAAAAASLEADGPSLQTMFVLVRANDVIAGELDATTAGAGFDTPEELLAELLGHFSGAMKSLGVEVKIAQLGEG